MSARWVGRDDQVRVPGPPEPLEQDEYRTPWRGFGIALAATLLVVAVLGWCGCAP